MFGLCVFVQRLFHLRKMRTQTLQPSNINPHFPNRAFTCAAFEISLIDDVEHWFKALDSRNLLSHIYDEQMAGQAKHWIKNEFEPMLRQCVTTLHKRTNEE